MSVAKALLGCEIHRQWGDEILRARIVETEAYLGESDLASHGKKRTKRSEVMFGPPGHLYVYFIYGNYFMLNFVTEREGVAGAVLIRAVEPVQGFDTMKRLRGFAPDLNLTNGPAKLALALGIDQSLNGKRIGSSGFDLKIVGADKRCLEIVSTPRIGISQSKELPLRFFDSRSRYVSKG